MTEQLCECNVGMYFEQPTTVSVRLASRTWKISAFSTSRTNRIIRACLRNLHLPLSSTSPRVR